MKPETPRPRPITHTWLTVIINTQLTTRARQQKPTLPTTTNQKPQRPSTERVVTANGSRDSAQAIDPASPNSSVLQGLYIAMDLPVDYTNYLIIPRFVKKPKIPQFLM
jgi:hypothetical protein